MDFYKIIAPPSITEKFTSISEEDVQKVEATFRDQLSPNTWLGGCSLCGIEIMVPPSEIIAYAKQNMLLLQDTKILRNCELTTDEELVFLAKTERVQLDTNVTCVIDPVTSKCTYLNLRTRYFCPFDATPRGPI